MTQDRKKLTLAKRPPILKQDSAPEVSEKKRYRVKDGKIVAEGDEAIRLSLIENGLLQPGSGSSLVKFFRAQPRVGKPAQFKQPTPASGRHLYMSLPSGMALPLRCTRYNAHCVGR